MADVACDGSSCHFDGCVALLAAYHRMGSTPQSYRQMYSSAAVAPDPVIVLVFLFD